MNLPQELLKVAHTIRKAIASPQTYYVGHAKNLDAPSSKIGPDSPLLEHPDAKREIIPIQARSEEEALRKVVDMFSDYFYYYPDNQPDTPTLSNPNPISYTEGSVKILIDAGYENFLCFGPNYDEVNNVLPSRGQYLKELEEQKK